MLSMVLGAVLALNAQTTPTEVTPNGYLSNASYVYFFGTTSDTLTNADTLTSVVRVKGNYAQDFNIKAYVDHVSGTAGGTLIVSHSMDGVTYNSVAGDTITLSSVTGDLMDTEVINKVKFLYPYMKLYWLQTGTAVTVPRVWIYTKIQ
jgi:hypothetical protein